MKCIFNLFKNNMNIYFWIQLNISVIYNFYINIYTIIYAYINITFIHLSLFKFIF